MFGLDDAGSAKHAGVQININVAAMARQFSFFITNSPGGHITGSAAVWGSIL
jgi:hypothetical protein